MSGYAVGDEVIIRATQNRRTNRDDTGTITRVARKYVYLVRYGREVAYDVETGYEKAGKYGSASRILTRRMAADEDERDRLVAALKQQGIRVGYDGIRNTISPRDMQRLLDVLDNPS